MFTKVQARSQPTRISRGQATFTIRRPPESAPAQTTVWDVRQARAVERFSGATTLQRQTGRWITGGSELVVRPRLETQVLSEPAARSLELRRVEGDGGG